MDSTLSPLCDLPSGLRMRSVGAGLVAVSFSLRRVASLTPALLEVVRLADAGLSNEAIAQHRGVSTHTVVRQMACSLKKLGVGSRLALATIPEVGL